MYLLFVSFVDYFRSVSKALEEIQMKEDKMVGELQKDAEQESKLKDEIEVCFRNSLSVLIWTWNRTNACRISILEFHSESDGSHSGLHIRFSSNGIHIIVQPFINFSFIRCYFCTRMWDYLSHFGTENSKFIDVVGLQ